MMRFLPLTFCLFVLLSPTNILAQSAPDNSLLPEINPQDIEIRSEFQARFPGLRRQPILGFNPNPRVFQIRADRMPFMESREDAVANISVTQLGRPEPPKRSIISTPDRTNGYIRGAFGSFISSQLEGYGYYEVNDKSILSARIDHRASGDHLNNQDSDFRYLDLETSYITRVNKETKLTVDLGALSDHNAVFDLSDNLQQNFIGETASKDYSGFSGQLSIQKLKNTLTGWDATVGGSMFNAQLDAGDSGLGGDLDEQQFHLAANYFWAGDRMYETYAINASMEVGNYAPAGNNAQDWMKAGASFEAERLFNFTTRVTATMGLAYVSDPMSDTFYLAPEVNIKHNFSDSFSITGSVFGKPGMHTQQEFHQYNRFLNTDNVLRKSYTKGANAETNFQLLEGNRIYGGLSYEVTNNYAYYLRSNVALTGEPGFYNVNYAKANVFELYGGISQQLIPDIFWADVKAYTRSPKLDGGSVIPYEEKLGLEGALSYKPMKSLTINGWAEYIGKRESPETSDDLSAFVLLNAGGEYKINETFGVYAKLLNILGQDYELWNGYTERPLQIFGGITINF